MGAHTLTPGFPDYLRNMNGTTPSLAGLGGPPPSLPGGKQNNNIKVKLENENLWNQFSKNCTEMIITKLGR